MKMNLEQNTGNWNVLQSDVRGQIKHGLSWRSARAACLAAPALPPLGLHGVLNLLSLHCAWCS